MPEVFFDVRWPDGSAESFYSPSLIVEEHFGAGLGYTVSEFVRRSRTCMRIADDRVRAKYGFGCAESMWTIARIEASAARFAATDEVKLETFRR
jgi:uncharacterized repeat protein (TIGR04042 family)